MKKITAFLICTLFFVVNVFSEVYSFQKPIPAHHWIYDALYKLNAEQKRASVLDNAPLTVSELYMNFLCIDKDDLSDAGEILYEKVENFFTKKSFLLDFDGARFTTAATLNPAATVKTNNSMDWSYASSYTSEYENYLANSSCNTLYNEGLVTVPIIFDFADTVCLDFECYLGNMPYWSLSKNNYSFNIPNGKNGGELMSTPTRAYGSIGKSFGNWGINAQMGMSGLEIGRAKTGTVIYNSAFQTDSFFQLNFYSPKLKYNLDVSQIDINRFMYIHYFEVIPFSKLKISVLEGTMVKGPLEIRYFNPLVLMHHYFGWRLYKKLTDPDKAAIYGETDFCAYLGISFDYNPCQYLRLYLNYAQNELKDIEERLDTGNDYRQSYPDSLGVQIGADLSIPYNEGYYIGNFEGIYTTPFCYLKQTKDASLVRVRENDNYPSAGLGKNSSWIGTPFGPDALGFNLSFGYEETLKWKVELSYLFLAHGTNSLSLFDKKATKDGKEYEAYYPTVIYNLEDGADPAKTKAMTTYKLTGIIQYTNRITASGSYYFKDNISIDGSIIYSFIFNHRAVTGQFAQGLEATLSFKYEIF